MVACRLADLLISANLQHAVEGYFCPALDAGADLDAVDYAAFYKVFECPGEVLGADAVHGGAEAAMVVEGDDLFAALDKLAGEAVDEMNLSADGKHGAGGGVIDKLDELLG